MRNSVTNATYTEQEDDEIYMEAGEKGVAEVEFGGNFMSLASWVVQGSGLRLVVDDGMVPDGSPIRLNTDSLSLLFPKLNALGS
jgi:hypothetical protein